MPLYIGSDKTTDQDPPMSDTVTDQIKLRRIKLEGATMAPIIMFDEVPVFGSAPGYGRITLSAILADEAGDGAAELRRVVVAHLRCNTIALRALRNAIDGILLLEARPDGDGSSAN